MKKKLKWENIIIVCILALLAGAISFSIIQSKEILVWNHTNPFSIFYSNPFTTNVKNILVLGIPGKESNGGFLTDALLVVHIDFLKNKVSLISIPRDLLVQIPNSQNYIKINHLLLLDNPSGKITNTKMIRTKIENITSLNIDDVVVIDLDGFRYFIDALGGINIYLEQPIYDPNLSNPDNPNEAFYLASGWNFLDGKKAAKFIRSRYGPTGDFYRIGHQHDLLIAIFQKLKTSQYLNNPSKLLEIWNSWKGYIYTDLSINDGIKLATFMSNLTKNDIQFLTISHLTPEQLLMSSETPDFGYILIPSLGLENYSAIQNYVNKNL